MKEKNPAVAGNQTLDACMACAASALPLTTMQTTIRPTIFHMYVNFLTVIA